MAGEQHARAAFHAAVCAARLAGRTSWSCKGGAATTLSLQLIQQLSRMVELVNAGVVFYVLVDGGSGGASYLWVGGLSCWQRWMTWWTMHRWEDGKALARVAVQTVATDWWRDSSLAGGASFRWQRAAWITSVRCIVASSCDVWELGWWVERKLLVLWPFLVVFIITVPNVYIFLIG